MKGFCFILLIINALSGFSQSKNITQIKTEIEKSPNSPLYVKDVLKKKFKLDTVVVTRTTHFNSLSDSLAYTGLLRRFMALLPCRGKNFWFRSSTGCPIHFIKSARYLLILPCSDTGLRTASENRY
jgi:hypothetical protein